MLIRVSSHAIDAALAMIVIPRSFSRSFEIHDPLGDPLILAEGAGLLEQAVHERRLAVIDVGDNGDIAQLHFHANQIRRVRTASRSYPTQTTFF